MDVNAKTVWERIMDVMKANNIEAYPPATKKGECTYEYVVVKQEGSSQYLSFSSEAHYYTFLLYVPQHKYASFERFKKTVKDVIREQLYPLIMPTGLETPEFFDDTFNAHMVSIQYRNNVHNARL